MLPARFVTRHDIMTVDVHCRCYLKFVFIGNRIEIHCNSDDERNTMRDVYFKVFSLNAFRAKCIIETAFNGPFAKDFLYW